MECYFPINTLSKISTFDMGTGDKNWGHLIMQRFEMKSLILNNLVVFSSSHDNFCCDMHLIENALKIKSKKGKKEKAYFVLEGSVRTGWQTHSLCLREIPFLQTTENKLFLILISLLSVTIIQEHMDKWIQLEAEEAIKQV